MDRIRRVAVLTSGGDSPGLNACIRAVVRMAIHHGWESWGVRDGYAGLINGEFTQLSSRSVSHIVEVGGTLLGSSRSDAFREVRGLREALRNLNEMAVDGLVVIGGDGSMRGARSLHEGGIATVGVPATIQNDVCGTDVAIGVDTALNTALDAMDRIKDTASSHQHAFLVELAGSKSGYLALMAGIAGGAEIVCTPERPVLLEEVAREVAEAYVRGKKHCVVTVSEGCEPGAAQIAEYLDARKEETGFGVRLSMVGQIQRGGSPTAGDRLLATRLGAAAVDRLRGGESGVMVGLVDGEAVVSPLVEVTECTPSIDEDYYEMARLLAR